MSQQSKINAEQHIDDSQEYTLQVIKHTDPIAITTTNPNQYTGNIFT